MSKVINAFTTYQAVGNREDLSNAIYNIDPFDTPVVSAARRRNVKNRFFDWQTEFLPTVNLNNAQVEGFLLSNAPAQPTIRMQNATQISQRNATVSGSQEESDAAGKSSEMAHQMAMAAKVLKSDMESILCSRQPRVDGSDGATPVARQTESFPHAIALANNKAGIAGGAVAPDTPGGIGGPAGTLPTTQYAAFPVPTTPVQLAENMLGNAMQTAYQNGASPSLWVVGPGVKRTVSTFVGRSTTQVLVGKTEVVSTVDVIATDFGRVKCIPSRWVPVDVGILMDPDYIAVSFFRAFRQYLMARTGDAETRMIVVEWGTETRNSLAHVLFNGISP